MLSAQTAFFDWATSTGGIFSDISAGITIGSLGNVYSTGSYRGTADFDPGVGTFTMTSNGGEDIYIQKLDASGNFIWAKSLGGTLGDNGLSISADAFGNIYVCGNFQGTVDFNPSGAIVNLTSNGNKDIFIQKLDGGGNLIWAISIGGPSGEFGNSIYTDSLGYVYVTGSYGGTVDFDPGGATFNMTSNGGDAFILKLDALGSFIWAKSIGGAGASTISKSINVDATGNVYMTGNFIDTADFDPGIGTFNLSSKGNWDIFILKLDALGNFKWAISDGGIAADQGNSITTASSGNVYATGYFGDVVDFDPGVDTFNLISNGLDDVFIQKLDSSGNFIWAKSFGASGWEHALSIAIDTSENVYAIGDYVGVVDFDPGGETFTMTANGNFDVFIEKLDSQGNFLWAKSFGGTLDDFGYSLITDISGHVYATGVFEGTADFDPNGATSNLTSNGVHDLFVLSLQQPGVLGSVYNDLNADCIRDSIELGLSGWTLMIDPGNIVVQTNAQGIWFIDSLPIGTYTIAADTSGKWKQSCPGPQVFSVVNPYGYTYAPSFGLVSDLPCASPDVSIHAPILRRCSTNKIYVQACNQNTGTAVMDSAFVDVQLDALFTVLSASLSYTSLGNNQYRFDVGSLYPGVCTTFTIDFILNCGPITGRTLCMQAELSPVDSCVFDTVPDTTVGGVSLCTLPWDKSSLMIQGNCVNDSIRFVVHNTGDPGGGDMTCFSAVRVYIDGQFVLLDSVQLLGGDSAVFVFSGDGRTWRLEADQHPLHPGNSHPNASVELCGNSDNWTSDLVNSLPMDDADPIIDIYCGLVTGSFDPNDKTGYPLGVSDSNYIAPNQDLQYVIRFQNTGTDTAFTVVITDTLSMDLNIFSVSPGHASHSYTFRMYGPRVLEWTFDNILLPDSNTNEPESHGFVVFKVAQNSNLLNGTRIQNAADIYFDFNAPVITNQTSHLVNDGTKLPPLAGQTTVIAAACNAYTLNGFTYTSSGTYMQNMVGVGGLDSILTLNLTVYDSISSGLVNLATCISYTVPSGDETYTASGTYMDTIPNSVGCDSVLTINLTIQGTVGSTVINPVTCLSYTVPSGDETYTASGTYMDTMPNAAGCDSVLSINLIVNPQPTVSFIGLDSIYCMGGGVFTDSLIGSPSGGAFSGPGIVGNIFNPYSAGLGTFTIVYSYTDGNGCTESTAESVVVESCVAIEGQEVLDLVKIYPNPVNENITFEFESGGDWSIMIYNSTGLKVMSFTSTERQVTVELDTFAKGLYFYSISSLRSSQTPWNGKFLKM